MLISFATETSQDILTTENLREQQGIPVLEVLRKNNLTDVCCVVTRYFGGILLGGGGLVRAYSHSTALAIEAAEVLKMYKCSELILSLSYDLYGKITYIFF